MYEPQYWAISQDLRSATEPAGLAVGWTDCSSAWQGHAHKRCINRFMTLWGMETVELSTQSARQPNLWGCTPPTHQLNGKKAPAPRMHEDFAHVGLSPAIC